MAYAASLARSIRIPARDQKSSFPQSVDSVPQKPTHPCDLDSALPVMNSEMVDLLVSDSLWVREKAKETLGVDLGARLIGILFRQIHAVLSDFFDKETGYPKTSEMYTVFVEQSIGVATMVLTRLDEAKASSSTSKVDIGSLMVLFVASLVVFSLPNLRNDVVVDAPHRLIVNVSSAGISSHDTQKLFKGGCSGNLKALMLDFVSKPSTAKMGIILPQVHPMHSDVAYGTFGPQSPTYPRTNQAVMSRPALTSQRSEDRPG